MCILSNLRKKKSFHHQDKDRMPFHTKLHIATNYHHQNVLCLLIFKPTGLVGISTTQFTNYHLIEHLFIFFKEKINHGLKEIVKFIIPN